MLVQVFKQTQDGVGYARGLLREICEVKSGGKQRQLREPSVYDAGLTPVHETGKEG